jgi:acetyl esterase/lipase
MPISFRCSHCGRAYTTTEQWVGKTVKCKECGHPVQIPAAPPAPDVDPYGLADLGTGEKAPPAAATMLPPRGGARAAPPAPGPAVRKAGSKKSKTKSGNQAWIFGGAAGAIVLLAVIGIGIWLATEGNQAGQPEIDNPAAAAAQPGESVLGHPAVTSRDNGTWTMPPLSQPAAGAEIEPGVLFSEVSIQPGSAAGQPQPGHRGKLWRYLPKGQHPAGSLPCILIAGAGSNLITGMDLGDGDRREHLPYARAGFAVVAYEVDGRLPEGAQSNPLLLAEASQAFANAEAGLVNTRVAIEFATTRIPAINPKRLYAVGHSSAATLALLVAENEPRIAGCVAFAPAVDVAQVVPKPIQGALPRIVIGADQLFSRFNPRQNESKIACPLFLFYADDDDRFATQVRELGERLKAAGNPATVSHVASGGHYDSMIQVGVPRAIEWLKSLGERRS